MFINYIDKFSDDNLYGCRKPVYDYLIYVHHLVPITRKSKKLYFRKNEKLKNALDKMGILLKVISWF